MARRLTDGQHGSLTLRLNEIKRRVEEGTLPYETVMVALIPIAENGTGKSVSIDRVCVLDANTIEVNLDAPPFPPIFSSATVVANAGGGWVKVEKRKDGLYQDGCKIELHLEQEQVNGKTIRGEELLKKLAHEPNIHPNVLDAAVQHNLMPDEWKTDGEKGRSPSIHSFAVVFRNSYGRRCILCWSWGGMTWQRMYNWLDGDQNMHDPSAIATNP